jgi:hypothetical protein
MKNVDGIEIDSKMLNLMKKAQSISLIIYQMRRLSLPGHNLEPKIKLLPLYSISHGKREGGRLKMLLR